MVDHNITTYFNEIYERTFKNTIRYISAKCSNIEDITDICQEVYTEVYTVLSKKGVRYINNPEAFVTNIAKSKVYRHYSKSEKIKGIPIDEADIEDEDLGSYTIEDDIITKQLAENVAGHLRTMKGDVKRIFYLYYYSGLSIAEIADELNMSESNVKNKLYRTVRELRKLYRKDD